MNFWRPKNKANTAAIVVTLCFVLAAALWPRGEWVGLGVMAGMLLGAGCGLQVGWGSVLKKMARVEIFMLGVAGLAVFQPGGVWLALNLLAKAHICVAAMLVMGRFVSFGEFLDVLKSWRLPAPLVMSIAMMERYRGVLGREWQRLRGARQSRTFENRGWRGFPLADCLGALLARSLARAERIGGAMMARGWK